MARAVVSLRRSTDAAAVGYDVRLGPLRFVTPADTVSEEVGGSLEAIGAAIAEGDPRPPALSLKLPLRGARREVDRYAAGLRLRRQTRALLNNARWRAHGFMFLWQADPDLDLWLRVGGGTIAEEDPGVSLAEFSLELRDVYIVGRPGTHRPGRRVNVADRRTGLVARDTRRLLYSTDFAAVALPTDTVALPGDTVDLVASGNRPVGASTLGPLRGARRLWRALAATDGETLTYLPDEALLTGQGRYLDLEEPGSVRVWDRGSSADVPQPSTAERDTDPDVYLGWERIYGDVLQSNRYLAIDNGACRLIWLGPAGSQGLAIEYWDDALGRYRRDLRVIHATGVREARIIELTQDRAVVEWRAGENAMRAILQRGWWGPRLESYADGGGTAALEVAGVPAAVAFAASPAYAAGSPVEGLDVQGRIHLWAHGTDAPGRSSTPSIVAAGKRYSRTRVYVAQLAAPPGPNAAGLGGLSLIDAQAVPVLIGRR